MVYLNDVKEKDGGSTVFPVLNIKVQPSLGTALYFRNMDKKGQVQPETLHGGSEILSAGTEKWACNIWIREKPFVNQ